MMFRRSFALAILSAILATAPTSDVEVGADCAGQTGAPGCVIVGAWYTWPDEDTLTIFKLPLGGTYIDTEGEIWFAKFEPFCVGQGGDHECQGFSYGCGPPYAAAMALWMVLSPQVGELTTPRIGPMCFAGQGGVAIGPQIQALVEDEIGADPPPIVLQPLNAIVNLPMLASTEAPGPITIEVDDPIAGTAEATPEYVWTFADDAAAHGPGLQYDGTSPTANPGYYVAYTYRDLGVRTVELEVTWRVTFTVPGNPPVPLDDVIRTATTTTQVRAAGSELVGG